LVWHIVYKGNDSYARCVNGDLENLRKIYKSGIFKNIPKINEFPLEYS
jgi:hypothetical protein